MDKKPQVFPNSGQGDEPTQEKVQPIIADQNEIAQTYTKPEYQLNEGQIAAAEAMRKKTEEQMKLRDEQLRKNLAQTEKFERMTEEATKRPVTPTPAAVQNTSILVETPVKQPVFQPENHGKPFVGERDYIKELSQPDFNSAFDVIPLPSEGKIYAGKRPNVRVSYMSTADENILTSPNLLQSGEFLEILINRKLLEPNLRYKDLHVGDRNAIMLWLRATGYGEMYPFTLLDEKDVAFETSVNLNTLKTKKLGAEPDDEGLFDYVLPLSKTKIKFRLLNTGDQNEIDNLVEADKMKHDPLNRTNTYKLERILVEVGGNRDKAFIKHYANTMRLPDGNKLIEYISEIESGVVLDLEVGTPGGGSVKTFLPLNFNFFWPNLRI